MRRLSLTKCSPASFGLRRVTNEIMISMLIAGRYLVTGNAAARHVVAVSSSTLQSPNRKLSYANSVITSAS